MADISSSYETIFGESYSLHKPTCDAYREFCSRWNWKKIAFEFSDEKIEKVKEIYQIYLTTALEYLTYSIQKNYAEQQQDKFEEQIREQKRLAKRH